MLKTTECELSDRFVGNSHTKHVYFYKMFLRASWLNWTFLRSHWNEVFHLCFSGMLTKIKNELTFNAVPKAMFTIKWFIHFFTGIVRQNLHQRKYERPLTAKERLGLVGLKCWMSTKCQQFPSTNKYTTLHGGCKLPSHSKKNNTFFFLKVAELLLPSDWKLADSNVQSELADSMYDIHMVNEPCILRSGFKNTHKKHNWNPSNIVCLLIVYKHFPSLNGSASQLLDYTLIRS